MRQITTVLSIFGLLVPIFGFTENEKQYYYQIQKDERDLIEKTKDYQKPDYQIPTACYESNHTTFSGYLRINITTHQSGLGFILHTAKGVNKEQLRNLPTIIWLGGGPGMSSQYANFYGVGPFYVYQNADQSFNLTENEYSWTNEYNMIFIDQPINTGLSYAENEEDIPTNQSEVSAQFYSALIELYENENGCFKKLGLNTQDTPLFIYGESYAGKFIPSIAEKIVKAGNSFNLQGIGYFGGLTSPKQSMIAIVEQAYENYLISEEQKVELMKKAKEGCDAVDHEDRQNAMSILLQILQECSKNVSYYNIKEEDSIIENKHQHFLNSKVGKEMFKHKIYQQYYQFQSNLIRNQFMDDIMKEDIIQKVEFLLSQQINVNILSGEFDLIVPHQSATGWMNQIQWKDIEHFKSAQIQNVTLPNQSKIIGTLKQYKNLQYSLIKDAGHFTFKDQPQASFIFAKKGIEEALYFNQKIKK